VKDDLTGEKTNNLWPIIATVLSVIAVGLHFVKKKPVEAQ